MRLNLRKLMMSVMVLALATPMALAGSGMWLHVKVDDGGETVRVNVPLSLVESILPAIKIDELQNGRLRIDALAAGELDGIDLRQLWDSVRDLDDAEFVTIDGDDESVRVYKEGDFLQMDIEENGREHVAIRIPMEVVDALFSGEPGELDLMAALDALGNYSDTDLVHVQDGDSTVRIWIDARNTTD